VIEEARCLRTTTPPKRSQREGEGHTSEQYESRDMVARPRYLDTRQPWARLENLKLNNQPYRGGFASFLTKISFRNIWLHDKPTRSTKAIWSALKP